MTMNPDTNGQPVAGWYADPQNAAQLRWWDGAQWSTHTTPVPQPAAPATPAAAPSPAYAPKNGVPQYGEYSTTPHPTQAAQPANPVQHYATAQPYAAEPYAAQPYGTAPVQPKVAEGTPTASWHIWVVAVAPILGLLSLLYFDVDALIEDSYAGVGGAANSMSMMTDPGYWLLTVGSWLLAALVIVAAILDFRWLKRQGYQLRFHWAWSILSSLVYVIGRSVVVKRQAGRGFAPMWAAIVVTVIGVVIVVTWTVMLVNATLDMVVNTPGLVS